MRSRHPHRRAVVDLRVGENAPEKSLTVPRASLLEARHFHEIHADPEDHHACIRAQHLRDCRLQSDQERRGR